MSKLKDLLLPVPGRIYTSVPWGWVICLVGIEIVAALVLGVIMTLMNVNLGTTIGVVTAMTGGMMFAMYAENRSPGVLTKALKFQLALRSAGVVSILGTSATAPAFLGETKDLSQSTTALIIAGVFVVTFLLNWGVHYIGLGQGTRVVRRQREALAARAGDSTAKTE